MPALSRPALGILLAFGTAVISGVSVFVNAHALRAFGEPALYTTAKNAVAAFLLIALLTLATRSRSAGIGEGLTMPRTWRERAGLVAVGVIGGGIPFLLFFEGLARATSSDAAFLHKTLVIWVALLAVTLLRERLSLIHVGAIALLMVGQAIAGGGLGIPALDAAGALILAATLLWSIEVVVAKVLLRRLSALTVGVARMGIGVLVLLAFTTLTGRLAGLGSVDATAWLWVAATGVILTGYVATWYAALARAQAVDVSAVLVLGVVITAALARGADLATLQPSSLGLALITLGALAIGATTLRSSRQAR